MNHDAAVELYLKAKEAYYNSRPIMGDAEFDLLEESIRERQPDHPALSLVGAPLRRGEHTVAHVHPMLSMDKALDAQALERFMRRAEPTPVVATAKLDGLSCNLEYKDGILICSATRGDGEKGTDITAKTRHVSNVRSAVGFGEHAHIRGELVMSFQRFDELNVLLQATRREPLSNPRNGAAGILNEDAVDPEKLAFVEFVAYDVVGPEFATYTEKLDWLEANGFRTPARDRCNQAAASAAHWAQVRSAYPYPIDGVVHRLDDEAKFQEMGHTSHHFRGAVAYKFPPDTAVVTVREILWSPGTQDISPVVHFDPVQLDGAVIRKASGHSVKNLIHLGAVPGAKLLLVRSGGVIPLLKRLE